ncbi:SCO family protein [Fredinandcohnia humi]
MKKLHILLMISFLLVLSSCANNGIEDPLNYEVSDFSYVNQDGEAFTLEDLKGKIWIADMIFTNCDTVCPPMTAHMAKLQAMVKEEGLDVEFVSFSVDPEVDTPEMLKEYGEKFEADFTNWHLLTGYSQEDIKEFAKDSFAAIAEKPKNQDQVLHVINFYLVDQNGTVLKEYNGVENTPYDQIIADIKKIQ